MLSISPDCQIGNLPRYFFIWIHDEMDMANFGAGIIVGIALDKCFSLMGGSERRIL
jgi:hypothetical protein